MPGHETHGDIATTEHVILVRIEVIAVSRAAILATDVAMQHRVPGCMLEVCDANASHLVIPLPFTTIECNRLRDLLRNVPITR